MCSTSLFVFDACGAVATTAGANLTAYNPSTAYNNQWASMTNARYDSTASAKVDFGNCNAIVLRCAQPKCANGGCGEKSVAAGIVAGCVKSNDKCKQYGDDLIDYMTAQLVANSQAKINASNAEQIQAAQMAAQQAQAAAQQAQQAQQQQMAEMQSSMQQQMQQMQQQMAEQNAQSAQAIADALAASQKQQQQAISEMRSAAETAAQVQVSGNVITAQDEDAIARGVSEDVLVRNNVSGQIVTELDDAQTSLKEAKVAFDKAFVEYAGCDSRGDNCAGPKRVKKWRELASQFIEPYDNVVEKISNALDIAQVVGVDLSNIYMMLNNSCNSWGQYLCPGGGTVVYDTDSKGQKGAPRVCDDTGSDFAKCKKTCRKTADEEYKNDKDIVKLRDEYNKCNTTCGACRPCTLIKLFSAKDTEDVYQSWIDTEKNSDDNQVIVACASNAVTQNNLLARHARRKSGAGVLDMDVLEEWINYHEASTVKTTDIKEACSGPKKGCYCKKGTANDDFTKALNSKTIKADILCQNNYTQDGYCDKIKPEYTICDVHAWNAGIYDTPNKEEIEIVRKEIGDKVTLIAQQAYKQYEYLAATLRRLETSLKKSVLATQLEKAGANSEKSSGAGFSGGSDKTIYLAGAENCSNKTNFDSVYSCIQNNASLIITAASTNAVKACKQLIETLNAAKIAFNVDAYSKIGTTCEKIDVSCNKKSAVSCAQQLNFKVMAEQNKQKQQNQGLQLLLGGKQ